MVIVKNIKWTPSFVADYYRTHGSIVGKGGYNPAFTSTEDQLILSSTMPDAEIAKALQRPLRGIHIRRSKLKKTGLLLRNSDKFLSCSMPGCRSFCRDPSQFVIHMKKAHGVTITVEEIEFLLR